jgi:hypothetical protein
MVNNPRLPYNCVAGRSIPPAGTLVLVLPSNVRVGAPGRARCSLSPHAAVPNRVRTMPHARGLKLPRRRRAAARVRALAPTWRPNNYLAGLHCCVLPPTVKMQPHSQLLSLLLTLTCSTRLRMTTLTMMQSLARRRAIALHL